MQHFTTDVAIIGAGPVGLFAVFECGMLQLRCEVIDAWPPAPEPAAEQCGQLHSPGRRSVHDAVHAQLKHCKKNRYNLRPSGGRAAGREPSRVTVERTRHRWPERPAHAVAFLLPGVLIEGLDEARHAGQPTRSARGAARSEPDRTHINSF